MNAPGTVEGAQVWALMIRCGGQLRRAGVEGQVVGFDLAAVLALGRAMDVPPLALAEFFPGIEAAMVRQMRRRADDTEAH